MRRYGMASKSSAQPTGENGRRVRATPTKDFFVSMLVRDIELLPAIVDLVDNCVDGARRNRQGRDYHGFKILIRADADEFSIDDNCGGIPIDIARNYAFRFGREREVERDRHTIGQFGVGMKRALFKLGTRFAITSRTTTDSFELQVDVNRWLRDPSEWDFDFETYSEGERRSLDDTGTTIVVDRLHQTVSELFAETRWPQELRAELTLKHRDALTRGLHIELNDHQIKATKLELIDTDPFKPTRWQAQERVNGSVVDVTILCGLADSVPQAGGWYVFCNGRMVLGPDQSEKTAWLGKESQGLPKYHDEYGRFRGYAFFESDDPSALPWTTTKVGVDGDSPLWQGTQKRIRDVSKPVIRFLRVLDRNRDAGNDSVYEQLAATASVPLAEVEGAGEFSPPAMDLPLGEKMQGITYHRTLSEIVVAKRLLQARSNREVGERTFDYFMDAESES